MTDRGRGRPRAGTPELVVQTMLGVLMPRPGRPPIAATAKRPSGASYAPSRWEAFAAGVAASRCGVSQQTAQKYWRKYKQAGGETPEAHARRTLGALLDVEPYDRLEFLKLNRDAATTLARPLRKVRDK